MGLEILRKRFLALAQQGRLKFLAALAHELTICARDAYDVGEDGGDSMRLRCFNELQHRVLAHLSGHIQQDAELYPEEVLWSILVDYADGCGIGGSLEWIVARALPSDSGVC